MKNYPDMPLFHIGTHRRLKTDDVRIAARRNLPLDRESLKKLNNNKEIWFLISSLGVPPEVMVS